MGACRRINEGSVSHCIATYEVVSDESKLLATEELKIGKELYQSWLSVIVQAR